MAGISYRADGFPTVIECAVPFYFYECGGPIVDLNGCAIGVTIARPGEHGGMVIPGDCVRKLGSSRNRVGGFQSFGSIQVSIFSRKYSSSR